MPANLVGIVVGKSTYARFGILVNSTPIEAGWQGAITLEISNLAPFGVVLYAGEGIAQLLFMRLSPRPLKHYGQRGGAYQGQTTATLPAVVPQRSAAGTEPQERAAGGTLEGCGNSEGGVPSW